MGFDSKRDELGAARAQGPGHERQDVPAWPHGCVPPGQDEFVRRKKHRSIRVFHEGKRRCPITLRQALIACLGVVIVVSAGHVVQYYRELQASRALSAELREIYYDEPDVQPSATSVATAVPTAVPTAPALQTAVPAPTQPAQLAAVPYPDNPYGTVRSRFQKLQRQNGDIVAWLTVPGMLDEAVVQRDNSYYLRRDYRGYHNDNGAIFMEQAVKLSGSRPYTLILYGHNMKSGAMFGGLRQYENAVFYRHNAFVTCDTAYEDGLYVVFAVGTLSQRAYTPNYVDVSKLLSARTAWREEAIGQLNKCSTLTNWVDVCADDQLLLLVTCVEDDAERRYVAARRVRPDETQAQLQKLVDRTDAR